MGFIVSVKTGNTWKQVDECRTALAARKSVYKTCKEYWTQAEIRKPMIAKNDLIGRAYYENGKVLYQPMSSHMKFPLRADGTIKW